MRQFSWHVFSNTGNVETYLLYKELIRDGLDEPASDKTEEAAEQSGMAVPE